MRNTKIFFSDILVLLADQWGNVHLENRQLPRSVIPVSNVMATIPCAMVFWLGTDRHNFTCCHTEIEVADPTFYLPQSQCTDTGPTSPSADPITPGVWQVSHWRANFEVTAMTRPGKIPSQAGFEPQISRSRGGPLNH